jgi:hypothetical protein
VIGIPLVALGSASCGEDILKRLNFESVMMVPMAAAAVRTQERKIRYSMWNVFLTSEPYKL